MNHLHLLDGAEAVSTMDKLRSFAESREADICPLPDGSVSYGDVRAALDALAFVRDRADAAMVIVRAAARIVAAADACDREAERHPSSRSSAPVVRAINAMKELREALARSTTWTAGLLSVEET